LVEGFGMKNIFLLSFLVVFSLSIGLASAQTIANFNTEDVDIWGAILNNANVIMTFLTDLTVNNIVAQNITTNELTANIINANFSATAVNNSQFLRNHYPLIDEDISELSWSKLINFPSGCTGFNEFLTDIGLTHTCETAVIYNQSYENQFDKMNIAYKNESNVFTETNFFNDLINVSRINTSLIYLPSLSVDAPSPPLNTILLHALNSHGFSILEIDNEGDTDITVSRDNIFVVKNDLGITISKGQPVYVTGSTGNVANVGLALANSSSTLPAIGVALDDITAGSFGQVMKLGNLINFDTSAFNVGDQVYVSPSIEGTLTNIRPTYPNLVQRIGSVLVSGIGNGVLLVTTAPFIGGMETGTTDGFTVNTTLNATQVFINGSEAITNSFRGSGANVTTTTCSGTDKVSAINNATGTVTCSADESGGGGTVYPSIQMGNIYFAKTKTNIGTAVTQIYNGAFDPEINGMTLVNTTGYGEFIIEAIWDYAGTGNQRMMWFKHNNFTCLFHRSPTFTADQVPYDSGWQPIPSCADNQQFILTWYGNSTTAGDDPVAYGYNIYLR
jgi:hypothetical protein